MLDELNALHLWDFRIDSLRTASNLGEDVLTVLATRDFSYCHEAQVQFFDTVYMSCPVDFSHAQFAPASDAEIERIRELTEFDDETKVFRIIEDAGDSKYERHHFIAASRAVVTIETVYYYKRESLGPNESVAEWVT